ncbi:MarR family winged helix-turn-helix transcriptional regulator [Culicoidibacter larvae]|uniref:MarR family transcriptional regulator n=1 Tax=Culicoidibacter larvae TaxID=2579976 RepID=A0A5R8QEZ7_9FIRM|nr:MarR family transcriptional regulator [Culicoidibacter larvae]TLG76585.1 MarR family transcriptional regulator [Culicoidibacter larvae]
MACVDTWLLFLKAHRTLNAKLDKALSYSELTLSEFSVLEMLRKNGSQPIQQIGNCLGLTSGTMTYTVNKLEEKSYIVRKNCTNDHRVYYASLTDSGQAYIENCFAGYYKAMDDIFNKLSPQQQADLSELLYTIIDE